MIWKKISRIVIVCTIFVSSFFPVFTPRAHAFLGIADVTFTTNLKEIIKDIIDGIAMNLAQRMVDETVKSSIKWANSGFEGSPAFVDNPLKHIGGIANDVAGSYINKIAKGNLCTPFRPQITLSLQKYYQDNYVGLNDSSNTQCTFTGITNNLGKFYTDFHEGGWNGWFQMTQNDSNNPYGAYLTARSGLDSEIISKLNIENKKLDWGQGFKSKGDCITYNPDAATLKSIDNEDPPTPKTFKYELTKPAGSCIEYGPDKTPGTIIKGQLETVLPSGVQKLISVQHIEQLVSAFAGGILNKYVFGSHGLVGGGGQEASNKIEEIDIDGDDIPDGFDNNSDGQLDVCHHGLVDPNEAASNTNCKGSVGRQDSPYFIPICTSLDKAKYSLQKYLDFIQRNQFQKENANTWASKTLVVTDSVDNLQDTISRFEIMKFDSALFEFGKFTDFMAEQTASLAKDKDLKQHGKFVGFFAGGTTSDSDQQQVIIRVISRMLNYVKNFRVAANSCEKLNVEAMSSVPIPPVDPADQEGAPVSCSPDKGTAKVGEPVTWSITNVATVPVTFVWGGDEMSSETTNTVTIKYQSAGVKSARVIATITDSSGTKADYPFACESSVIVSSPTDGSATVN